MAGKLWLIRGLCLMLRALHESHLQSTITMSALDLMVGGRTTLTDSAENHPDLVDLSIRRTRWEKKMNPKTRQSNLTKLGIGMYPSPIPRKKSRIFSEPNAGDFGSMWFIYPDPPM